MADGLLRLYHALPAPLKSVVASVRGRQLQATRYTHETDRLVEEALARESWTGAQWTAWQEERLAILLERAATQVPYYRELWTARRRAGDKAAWDLLGNWPVLEKELVRQQPRRFVADDRDVGQMVNDHTSGTSGTSLSLWFDRESVRAWYALFEARWRTWYGVSRHDRWAILGGQLVAPVSRTRPPFWVWNAPMRQLYMSTYHLSPTTARAYAAALIEYRVRYVLGYPSTIFALAQEVVAAGLSMPPLAVVIANAEPVLASQREVIERAFGCPIRETYGMAETVAAASECAHGTLHMWPESGVHELLDGGVPVSLGSTGDLVATGLLNPGMPLIRYRVGDRLTFAPEGRTCACGRTLPIVQGVEGRVDDVLLTLDGRSIGRMDPVFKADLPIREAQIIQETRERIRVKVVPAEGYSESAVASIAERIRDRMGPVQVLIEPCDAIPRSSNGKFRAVVSLLKRGDTGRQH